MSMKSSSGLKACEQAFERLISGRPLVPGHVGLPAIKITSGVVSVEAGFDRGYLKAARRNHQALIARIKAYRNGATISGNSVDLPTRQHLSAAKVKITKLESDLSTAIKQRDAVIAQNCQLHERVRLLELSLNKLQPNLRHLRR